MRLRTLALPFLVFLVGCNTANDSGSAPAPSGTSSSSSGAATKGEAPRPKIGVSLLSFQNPFFKTIAQNVEEEAAKGGFDVVALSADEDVTKQTHQVQDFIVQKVAAIVLSPAESKVIVAAIKEANDAGIPVFTVDIPCREPGVKIACQVATDNKSGGIEAGKAVIEVLAGKPGKVAILHYKQAESCVLRVEGFREAIDAHNTANPSAKIEIVSELEGGGKKEMGFQAAEDLLQSQPELNAIFAINDPSALGAVAALERAGKSGQIAVIGFDGQLEGKQAIKDGKIYADPIQFPDQLGKVVAQKVIAYSKGEDVEPEILIPTKLYKKADAEADPELQK